MSAVLAPAQRVQATVLATQGRPRGGHLLLIALAGIAAALGAWAEIVQIQQGLKVSGLNRPVGWAVYITDFVFWVGIAHSGTLISAVLFLLRARFRTAIYRVAEAMTVFGVMTAGLFPVVHLGRPWFAYWLFPYPNQRHLWVNFRSPLMWDVFAVSTYFIVSAIFLVVGIVPDAAALRDASAGWRRRFYGVFAAGWRGTDEEWRHYARAYLYFAAFATPLVFSVHSVVSWDFAVSILPGWHSTIFPPYFVAGAIFSGIAMVVTLLVPLRKVLHLEELITPWHLDMTSRMILLTSLIVTYSYAIEAVMALRAGPGPELSIAAYRATGPFAPLYWTMVACNCVFPLFLIASKVRRSPAALLGICILVNVGMWLERFVIVVTSLHRDFLPSSWGMYYPTIWDWGTFLGTIGLFLALIVLFIRGLPMISIFEMRTLVPTPGQAPVGQQAPSLATGD